MRIGALQKGSLSHPRKSTVWGDKVATETCGKPGFRDSASDFWQCYQKGSLSMPRNEESDMAIVSLSRPQRALRGAVVTLVMAIPLMSLAGCKSEEEKFLDAVDALWIELAAENETFMAAVNADDGQVAGQSLITVEDKMIEFSDDYFEGHLCVLDSQNQFVCFERLVAGSENPATIKFMQTYPRVQLMGSIFETHFPGLRTALREPQAATATPPMPASEIDAGALLPPQSSD